MVSAIIFLDCQPHLQIYKYSIIYIYIKIGFISDCCNRLSVEYFQFTNNGSSSGICKYRGVRHLMTSMRQSDFIKYILCKNRICSLSSRKVLGSIALSGILGKCCLVLFCFFQWRFRFGNSVATHQLDSPPPFSILALHVGMDWTVQEELTIQAPISALAWFL